MVEVLFGQAAGSPSTTLLWLTGLGAIAALVGAVPTLRRAVQATIWRRPSVKRKLRGITTNMQLAYYEQLFGTGAFVSPQVEMRATVWVMADAYVLALSDSNDKVVLYSVTTRSRWFRPVFFRGRMIDTEGASLRLALGKTKFAELPSQPDGVQAGIGAHTANYDESHWYGNPGHYQYYVYSANLAGYPHEEWVSPLLAALQPYGNAVLLGRFASGIGGGGEDLEEYLASRAVQDAREKMRVNTLTVSTIEPEKAGFYVGFGPHEHLVRLLYRPTWRVRIRSRWQRWKSRR